MRTNFGWGGKDSHAFSDSIIAYIRVFTHRRKPFSWNRPPLKWDFCGWLIWVVHIYKNGRLDPCILLVLLKWLWRRPPLSDKMCKRRVRSVLFVRFGSKNRDKSVVWKFIQNYVSCGKMFWIRGILCIFNVWMKM